jgi:hypothetical protein
MDTDDHADVPPGCTECGKTWKGVKRCQMKAPGTANTYSRKFRRLCPKCRKKKGIRGRFRIVQG